MIKVRLGSHSRDHVHSFHATLKDIPHALTIFHVAGEDDYLVHVAVESAAALRDLVLEHITVHPVVRHTETQLVFEVMPGAGLLPALSERGPLSRGSGAVGCGGPGQARLRAGRGTCRRCRARGATAGRSGPSPRPSIGAPEASTRYSRASRSSMSSRRLVTSETTNWVSARCGLHVA